ncbi:MAG: hypothetical protein ACE5LV_04885 [Candidatus Aminicenantales bacterium]
MTGFSEHRILLFLAGLIVFLAGFSQEVEPRGRDPTGVRRVEIMVPSDVAWTDTGVEVEEGDVLFFRASGQICLQRGNPVAYCGPDGYNVQTLQQPIEGENLGALIGKVYFLISVEVDEETGEEVRNEIEEMFPIGSQALVSMPIAGRLFLGINEDLVGDNEGAFRVQIIITEERRAPQTRP